MFFIVTALQKTTVDLRVQRFDATVEHFWETGVVRNIDHGETAVLQVFGGASRGEQLHTELCQSFGKVEQTGFIRNRKKGAGDGHG